MSRGRGCLRGASLLAVSRRPVSRALTAGRCALGQVIFRSGVSRLCPEGAGWLAVATPRGSEASQVSCGPSGLTWALTWDGAALVRTGSSRDTPHGERGRTTVTCCGVRWGDGVSWLAGCDTVCGWLKFEVRNYFSVATAEGYWSCLFCNWCIMCVVFMSSSVKYYLLSD